MRKPTDDDADLLLRLYEIRRDPELRRARQWFLHEFKPGAWSEIKARYMSFQDEDRWFRMTTSYWEMVGAMVNRGVLHPDLFFDHTGEDIVTWERCKTWIADARADIRPSYLIQFERLVAAHQEYRKKVNAAVLAEAQAGSPRAGLSKDRAAAKAGPAMKAGASTRAGSPKTGSSKDRAPAEAAPTMKAGASAMGGAAPKAGAGARLRAGARGRGR